MKRKSQPRINFFNASILLEDLSENEMFKLKGGTSDTGDPYEELPEVVVIGETPDDDNDGNEDEDPGYDPEDGYDWDDADNDPTDDDGWDGEGGDEGEPEDKSEDSGDDKGPWLRDEDGNLIMTPTGKKISKLAIGKYRFDFTEVTIQTPDGQEIIAFVVTAAYNSDGDEIPIQEEFKSNCTGLAFAGGDVWITDLADDGNGNNVINQGEAFENLLDNGTLYTEVSKEEADYVVASYNGEIMHSGEYDADTDTYTWKNTYDPVESGSYEKFSETYDDDLTVKYYKRNY